MVTSKSTFRGVVIRDRTDGGKSIAFKNVLTGKDGIEVSIPNIIVAIVVSLVVIASVVAGVVFIVPWAQNSAAQGDIQTVQSAQQLYYSQQAPPTYGSAKALVDAQALLSSEKAIAIKANRTSYCVGTVSGDDKYYWITSATTTITSTYSATAVGGTGGVVCPTIAQIDTIDAAKTGIKTTSPVL
jgi:type II secretory pathway pseudopilin PulG